MNLILNLAASASGLWKKVAAILPLVGGAGSILVGVGNIAIQLAACPSAAAMLVIFKGLSSTDPNVHLIVGGLVALGIHQNHMDQLQSAPADNILDKVNAAAKAEVAKVAQEPKQP